MRLSCRKFMMPLLLCIACCARCPGQSPSQSHLDSLARQFVKTIRSERKEKIILLTDKSFYAAGENIWLKAWCLDSLSNRFLYASKNMFVELLNDRDSVIAQLLFNIPERRTAGTILLPGSLREGYYWLRAYTTSIFREDSNRIFVKPVYVVNANKPDSGSLSRYAVQAPIEKDDTAAPAIRFFPEGGSIIAGTTATVAFRSTGARGEPLEVTGYVTDTRNDTVARFITDLPGLGRFSFDAYNPRKYVAHIVWRGREVLYPLPLIDQYANQLSVVSQDDRTVRLRVSQGDSLYKKHKVTHLLGIGRDSLCFAATGTDMYEVNVPKSNFPPGKATFFLWDDRDRLVSERSVYMTGTDSGGIVAATDKAGYAPGEKVNLNIDVKAQGDNAIEALLAVSVTDDRETGNNLSIAVNGTGLHEVDDALPKRYTPEQIDLLMLGQSPLYQDWRYGPDSRPEPTRFADSSLLDLKGKVVDKDDEPMRRCVVNLFSSDNRFLGADTTNADGSFLFPLDSYNDGTAFTLKLTDLNGRGHGGKLILDKFSFPKFPIPARLKEGLSAARIAMIRHFRDQQAAELPGGKELKPAIVQGRTQAGYDESKRVSRFSAIITSDVLKKGGVNVVLNALQSIPGYNTGMTAQAPFIIIDGVPLSASIDVNSFLSGLDADNIDFIEVLTGSQTAIYGMQGGTSVVLINTLETIKDYSHISNSGVATIYPKGYFNQSDVYASGYDRKAKKQAAVTDQPSTLYWNANILTNSKGNAKVNFYTGRRQATYSAAIIGITRGGDIVSGKVRITCQ